MIGVSRLDVAAAATRLEAAGVGSPRHDAERLAELAGDSASDFAAYVGRRADREPLQHITGVAYFRYVQLAVGPGVFIPRPETELVAQAAIDFARGLDHPTVVDLCAGSGAIALSVASEVPTATVHAVEIDDAAMTWLQRNAAGTTVQVHQENAVIALNSLAGTIDVVVSNPPYIPLRMKTALETEVRDHDPDTALYGGLDGLDVIIAVVRRAAGLLRNGGLLVVEHDDSHGESVPALLAESGEWADIGDHKDLAGRPRFATAVRKTGP
ncbi:MAG: release factor glutamine methyltransferase [Frankiaceae bacterium]|nr:release factor glutamine methyltransferase [Frankiaceae bacterium]